MTIGQILPALLAARVVCACAQPGGTTWAPRQPPTAHSTPSASVAPPSVEAPSVADACNATAAPDSIGKLAGEPVLGAVRLAGGVRRVRLVKPGQAVTLDFRHDLRDVDVDDGNRITALRCG